MQVIKNQRNLQEKRKFRKKKKKRDLNKLTIDNAGFISITHLKSKKGNFNN